MNAQLEPIADTLRTTRKRQGLSQRALAAKAGVPQSHISKIENAAVDLQTTSLIAIARALGLELKLVPRQLLPAVESLTRTTEPLLLSLTGEIEETLAKTTPYERTSSEARVLNELLRDLHLLFFDPLSASRLRDLLKSIDRLAEGRKRADLAPKDVMSLPIRQLRMIRNGVVHPRTQRKGPSRSVYSLDDDDDDKDRDHEDGHDV